MKWTPEEIQFLKDNYPDKGSVFCAKHLNRSPSNIANLARYRKIRRNRKYPVDEHYWDKIDTEFKAYLLGFLLADGNISREGCVSIHLSAKDRQHLTAISQTWLNRDAVRFNAPPLIPQILNGRTIKSNGSVIISAQCKSWIEPLRKLKLVPAKSLALEFPNTIDDKWLPHMIRGYFDGDGCLCRKFSAGAARYNFTVLSSLIFCEKLQLIFQNSLGVKSYIQKKQQAISYLVATGNRQVKSLMDWLYKDATFFLKRKHDIYLRLLEDASRIATKPKTSKFKHVGFDKSRNKWLATWRLPNKTKQLGRFDTELEAANAVKSFSDSLKTIASPLTAPQ